MPSVNPLSFTSAVNEWMMKSHHPVVLHVFVHACNLINERREVLSIVTYEIGAFICVGDLENTKTR